ncbi:NAD(P)/FAD-dependent oxidoreductase [Saccharothrix coeruleofusca]|uniref:D-amino-acid oxidase n=1 Tax=Saccharothrix coeruleofusca TaxID=33919 RepID=A0A918EFL4_9PSEU|nr:FAD-binding oxidoreductase [Saccharothrix coeruleofusca]GGP64827.1 D-amino-acid oxidase [Saccharothrix coeruleofusca]
MVRVVVLGSGVLGASTAHHLARLGASVTLVSEAGPASGASGRSLSWLNSAAVRSTDYHRLRLLGIDRYRALAARLGGPAWLRFDGRLTWCAPDQRARLREVFAWQRAEGLPVEWLSAGEVAEVVAGVDPAAVPECGAVRAPDEGWVDLPSLIALLLAELTRLGGTVVTDAGRAEVVTSGGRAIGARTGSGLSWDADAVVLATGAGVPGALARLGFPIGDRTTTALLVRSDPVDVGLRMVLITPRVSIRPTPDGALVFDSAWSEEAVGRHGNDPDLIHSIVDGLCAEARAVLAGNPALSPRSFAMGPKPVPADGEPVLGPVPGVEGLHVAFSHSGATLGLVAGELLADRIVTGETHPLLAPFVPDRFAR